MATASNTSCEAHPYVAIVLRLPSLSTGSWVPREVARAGSVFDADAMKVPAAGLNSFGFGVALHCRHLCVYCWERAPLGAASAKPNTPSRMFSRLPICGSVSGSITIQSTSERPSSSASCRILKVSSACAQIRTSRAPNVSMSSESLKCNSSFILAGKSSKSRLEILAMSIVSTPAIWVWPPLARSHGPLNRVAKPRPNSPSVWMMPTRHSGVLSLDHSATRPNSSSSCTTASPFTASEGQTRKKYGSTPERPGEVAE